MNKDPVQDNIIVLDAQDILKVNKLLMFISLLKDTKEW